MKLEWKLADVLARQDLTVYALAREMGNQTHAVKLYRITNKNPAKRPRRADFDTLEQIIPALTRLTGQIISPNDLLELVEEPVQVMDSESDAWLNTDLSRLGEFEPFDWGESGAPQGQPIIVDRRTKRVMVQLP